MDIRTKAVAQNSHCVIKVRSAEWLEYTVNVVTDGLYTVEMRLAMLGTGGTFHLEVDGIDVTGPMSVPNTGGWYTWLVVPKTDVPLTAGEHIVRLAFDTNGPGGSVGVFDSMEWTLQAKTATRGVNADEDSSQLLEVLSSSGFAPYTNAWNTVDGDTNSLWVGAPDAGGWWVVLGYADPVPVSSVDILWDAISPTNCMILHSLDAEDWQNLNDNLDRPVTANYLWLILPDTAYGIPPAIREITVR